MSEAPTLSPKVPQPEHVPDSLVYEFDLFNDPELLVDAPRRVLDLVENAPPVFWTPYYGGHWMLVSHAANFNAARDTETFSSEVIPFEDIKAMLAAMPEGSPHFPIPVPINVDPPEHAKFRAPLQRVFSPKTINGLKDSITELARELIDSVADQGGCNVMTSIAEQLPVIVFLKMLGLPLEKLPQYRDLVRRYLAEMDMDASNVAARTMEVAEMMRPEILARREEPRDDIISMLWEVEIEGEEMSLDRMEDFCVLLFIAGLDTVMNGIGHGIRHLAEDQALQAKLRAEPALIDAATEEILRRYTFTVPPRRVDKDVEFEGVTMKKNDRALLFLPGADLDAKEYANSSGFDLGREKAHIAFNAGPHRCLGSHLARVELQICYREMLSRLPTFRIDPDHPPVYHGGHVIGPESLHILWDK